ncbi:unnamed protein product [Rotaria sordida]|uniref:Protein-tyrosine-phosphatase n=1 Tax=Rotaria sordida TaxID=392033 RepID=A0A813U891_9BILA|nr:unnamed protein product [Rotaria sordida]
MGGEMSLVLPHLYLGSLKDRTNSALMMKNKVKRILCIIDVPNIIVDKEEHKPTHILNIPAADVQEQDLAQYFEKCIEFIHQARIEHENILVHCQAGVSRSATIVLAYIMTIGDYDVEKAIQIVKGARGYIHPNPGFLTQLKKYYTNDVKKNWYRLIRRYPTYAFDDDEIFVKFSLHIYWQQFEPAFIAEPVYWSMPKKNLKKNLVVHYEPMMICGFAEQVIDNCQEQRLKRTTTNNEEKPSTSIIVDEQQILSHDKQVEKTGVVPSTTKHYHGSKNKSTSSKTIRRSHTMRSK